MRAARIMRAARRADHALIRNCAYEMEGQSAMMPLGASVGAPVECDMMVPSKAAQGNPRIEGVSCAAYQSTDV